MQEKKFDYQTRFKAIRSDQRELNTDLLSALLRIRPNCCQANYACDLSVV
jgi:hypothetical protein